MPKAEAAQSETKTKIRPISLYVRLGRIAKQQAEARETARQEALGAVKQLVNEFDTLDGPFADPDFLEGSLIELYEHYGEIERQRKHRPDSTIFLRQRISLEENEGEYFIGGMVLASRASRVGISASTPIRDYDFYVTPSSDVEDLLDDFRNHRRQF